MRQRPKKIRLRIQRIIVFLVVAIPIFLFKFLYPKWTKETLDELTDAVGIGMIYIPQIRREGDRLSKRFGHDYQTYCERVPKYLPNRKSL